MKAVRFQSVIDAAGTPEQHLLWTEPSKDKDLQKALKDQRVMTIHQSAVGTKADYGTVGLDRSAQGQILIFPHSLKAFEGKRVVGVNYDLYAEAPVKAVPTTSRAKTKKRRPKAKSAAAEPPAPKKKAAAKKQPPAKILPFPKPETEEEQEPKAELLEIKRKVRQALKALEQGKQVAAYETLKRLLQ
ncbi:MAG TPA: hypothetical protein VD994_02175 [Prosthecobacter sp.]|nr:hypothetical protein [Prosthecobacter sp.]